MTCIEWSHTVIVFTLYTVKCQAFLISFCQYWDWKIYYHSLNVSDVLLRQTFYVFNSTSVEIFDKYYESDENNTSTNVQYNCIKN